MRKLHFHSAESVFRGHPDKIADQISDAILDAHLEQDSCSKVACECLVKGNLVVVGGEVTSKAKIEIDKIVRETVEQIGYVTEDELFHAAGLQIISRLTPQSPSFTENIGGKQRQERVASDQGILYGFASNETPNKMPLPMHLAQRITKEIERARISGLLPYLRPDGKCQVTVAYDESRTEKYIESVVVSAQHHSDVDSKIVIGDLKNLLEGIFERELIRESTRFYINHFGNFIKGGPEIDCGLTGRKLLIDTYGSASRHGGGALSGKDPSKLDRSGAYAARWIAKNIVAADLAKECEVELIYAMGHEYPIGTTINTHGTESAPLEKIEHAVKQIFDLRPSAIIEELDLRSITSYMHLAHGGHMGREDLNMPWEQTEKAHDLAKISHE